MRISENIRHTAQSRDKQLSHDFSSVEAVNYFFKRKGENMKYELDVSKLDTQIVEVMQYEHNVTSVNVTFTLSDVHEDLADLTPCICLSMGDKITSENGLSYIITDDAANITWNISENYTQKAGTFFAQFAFIAADGTVKSYQKSFIFKVLPSVEWQKAALEYKPHFIETFWNKIVDKITSSLPTKVSELENDKGYVSTVDDLNEYAKKTDVKETLKSYTNASDVLSLMIAFDNSKKSKSICNSYYPFTISETLKGNMTFAPDSNSIYMQQALINKKTDGTNFALDSFALTVTSTGLVSPIDADVVFAINASDITKTGTVFFTAEDLFVSGENTIAYITFEKLYNICKVTYTRFNASSQIIPVKTTSHYLAISTPYNITSVKVTINPCEGQEPTTNFTKTVKLNLAGIER